LVNVQLSQQEPEVMRWGQFLHVRNLLLRLSLKRLLILVLQALLGRVILPRYQSLLAVAGLLSLNMLLQVTVRFQELL
jgi:hypothetical protein